MIYYVATPCSARAASRYGSAFFLPLPSLRSPGSSAFSHAAAMARCDACGKAFPIVPVDAKSVQYVRLMLANGKAAVDPDFL